MGKQSTRWEQLRTAEAERLMQRDPLTVALRGKIREFIETMVTTELTDALAAGQYARGPSRQGYRAMGGWNGR